MSGGQGEGVHVQGLLRVLDGLAVLAKLEIAPAQKTWKYNSVFSAESAPAPRIQGGLVLA